MLVGLASLVSLVTALLVYQKAGYFKCGFPLQYVDSPSPSPRRHRLYFTAHLLYTIIIQKTNTNTQQSRKSKILIERYGTDLKVWIFVSWIIVKKKLRSQNFFPFFLLFVVCLAVVAFVWLLLLFLSRLFVRCIFCIPKSKLFHWRLHECILIEK